MLISIQHLYHSLNYCNTHRAPFPFLKICAINNIDVPSDKTKIQCLKEYFAVSVYDASGQYSPNILFGNEYWLGSQNACYDLQLKQYYDQVSPFPTTFYVAKINLTIDGDHIPMVRFISLTQLFICKHNFSL